MSISETATYRLARKGNAWATFTPSAHDGAPTWQLEIAAQARGKTQAVFVRTSAMRPLATVVVRGESYPLSIGWHEFKRGVLHLGGARKIGPDGLALTWEMRWKAVADGGFEVEMRLRATPGRREGTVRLSLPVGLYQPELWTLRAAASRGHCAQTAWSAYSAQSIGFVVLDGEDAGWDDEGGGFGATWRGFPLGGGRALRFGLRFGAAKHASDARAPLVAQYAAFADALLHPVQTAALLDPEPAVAALSDPSAHVVRGAERLHWKPPVPGESGVYAGFPFYPADALQALSDRARFCPSDALARLIRFGAYGLAADFQVMGRGEQAEPNKGAFWDKRQEDGTETDFAGGQTHGIASNARLARAFFQLHGQTDDPLLRQSALNICQWLLLKMNDGGYFDGARVHATRGLPDDGRFLPQPCTLDGAEALRPFVLAYRATANEVWIKAAWKIAEFLLRARIPQFEDAAPASVASVLLGLLALDAEAPNVRLRAAVRAWGSWLRALPLPDPQFSPDGLASDLFDCARAGLGVYALDADPAFLRYAHAALAAVPPDARARSWQTVALHAPLLLSLACRLPGASVDFDSLSVTLGWRTFAPDPAAVSFLRVTAPGDQPVSVLPLVCRLNDQLLLLVLAPPTTETVHVLKNGKRPLLRDLLSDTLDSAAPLHLVPDGGWARIGLFTVDP